MSGSEILALYALPMARWMAMVAVTLSIYRGVLTAARMHRVGASRKEVVRRLMPEAFLVGVVIFYAQPLVFGDPVAMSGRWDAVMINLLYAAHFFVRTNPLASHLKRSDDYENPNRRKGDRRRVVIDGAQASAASSGTPRVKARRLPRDGVTPPRFENLKA